MKDTQVANKHIEGCSISLVNGKMKLHADKTHYRPTKTASITKLPVPNIGEDLKQLEFSNIVSNNAK